MVDGKEKGGVERESEMAVGGEGSSEQCERSKGPLSPFSLQRSDPYHEP